MSAMLPRQAWEVEIIVSAPDSQCGVEDQVVQFGEVGRGEVDCWMSILLPEGFG